MTIQVYFGVDEWKAEEVNVSVLFGMSSPWQNGPQDTAVALLGTTHRAHSLSD